jgi:hypothetical protein
MIPCMEPRLHPLYYHTGLITTQKTAGTLRTLIPRKGCGGVGSWGIWTEGDNDIGGWRETAIVALRMYMSLFAHESV